MVAIRRHNTVTMQIERDKNIERTCLFGYWRYSDTPKCTLSAHLLHDDWHFMLEVKLLSCQLENRKKTTTTTATAHTTIQKARLCTLRHHRYLGDMIWGFTLSLNISNHIIEGRKTAIILLLNECRSKQTFYGFLKSANGNLLVRQLMYYDKFKNGEKHIILQCNVL